MRSSVCGLAVDAAFFDFVYVPPVTILKTWAAILGLATGN